MRSVILKNWNKGVSVMILQIVTALATGAYVVLSRDAQPKRPDAAPREPFQHPADHLDCDGHPEFSYSRRAGGVPQ